VRQLTRWEYRNSVRDLFPRATVPTVELPPDTAVAGFDNASAAQGMTSQSVDQYLAAAELVADAVTRPLSQIVDCETETCLVTFAHSLAQRAYRRALTSEERTRYAAFIHQLMPVHGGQSTLAAFIQMVLQSPHFLAKPETSAPEFAGRDGVIALDGEAVAARLSFFFWGSIPDDALREAAASGALGTSDGVEAQARRLLADPRARDGVSHFYGQWLAFAKLDTLSPDATVVPEFSSRMKDALVASYVKFADRWFWDSDATTRTLFSDRRGEVDATLVPLYGATLDPAQRSGLLTQPGFLAGFSHPRLSAPVLRGVYVLERVLCEEIGAPPPGVNDNTAAASSGPLTTRQRYAAHVSAPACASCHTRIDGIGFGLEDYDLVGRFRTTENGLPIDASGQIFERPFSGGVALSAQLADSRQVEACAARQVYRFALGQEEQLVDHCTLEATMARAGGSVRELMIAVAKSDATRLRLPGK
jgi:hypothetical protein